MVDLCEKCGHRAVCRFREHYEECLQFIEDVVRCKDCRYYTSELDNGDSDCSLSRGLVFAKPDDFCSLGRRGE